MQIRLMGSCDLLRQVQRLVNINTKLSENVGSNDCRLYINVDDRDFEQWIDLIKTSEYLIEIDPNDFR